MTKLEKLIEELCPNGVEYKKIGEVSSFRRGSFPQPYGNSEWYDGEGAMPFVQVADIGNNMRLVDDTKRKISRLAQPKSVFAPEGSIVISLQGSIGRIAITQYDAYIDRTVAIFSDLSSELNDKYFVYQLQRVFSIKEKTARGSTIKTITKDEFTNFEIPVPSLDIQSEIVRILDNFTELTAELTAELIARKKQYEYYRDELFNGIQNYPKHVLNSLADIKRGVRVVKKDLLPDGEYPVYQNSLAPMGYYNSFNCESGTAYVISAGAAGEIGYCNSKFWAADDCLVFSNLNGVINRYIYHYLMTKSTFIKSNVRKASIPRLSRTVIEKIEIPVPPINEQERIVNILDRFDAICNDITQGIPAEIEARQKQYEYYRDKLLTFKGAKYG